MARLHFRPDENREGQQMVPPNAVVLQSDPVVATAGRVQIQSVRSGDNSVHDPSVAEIVRIQNEEAKPTTHDFGYGETLPQRMSAEEWHGAPRRTETHDAEHRDTLASSGPSGCDTKHEDLLEQCRAGPSTVHANDDHSANRAIA